MTVIVAFCCFLVTADSSPANEIADQLETSTICKRHPELSANRRMFAVSNPGFQLVLVDPPSVEPIDSSKRGLRDFPKALAEFIEAAVQGKGVRGVAFPIMAGTADTLLMDVLTDRADSGAQFAANLQALKLTSSQKQQLCHPERFGRLESILKAKKAEAPSSTSESMIDGLDTFGAKQVARLKLC